MIHYVMSIHDRASDTFQRPWFAPARGTAIRAFQDDINSKESPAAKHPDDYDLYELGTFDDNTGMFINHDQPKQIAIGKQMVITEH